MSGKPTYLRQSRCSPEKVSPWKTFRDWVFSGIFGSIPFILEAIARQSAERQAEISHPDEPIPESAIDWETEAPHHRLQRSQKPQKMAVDKCSHKDELGKGKGPMQNLHKPLNLLVRRSESNRHGVAPAGF
jgi:hypothetical protein